MYVGLNTVGVAAPLMKGANTSRRSLTVPDRTTSLAVPSASDVRLMFRTSTEFGRLPRRDRIPVASSVIRYKRGSQPTVSNISTFGAAASSDPALLMSSS